MSPLTTPQRTRLAAQRQLDAYNAHDIDAFAACYTPDVQWFDLRTGECLGQGRALLHERYGEMFRAWPDVHATLTSRSVVGSVAFDREVVTGRGPTPLHAMAVYDVDAEGLIAKVWFVLET